MVQRMEWGRQAALVLLPVLAAGCAQDGANDYLLVRAYDLGKDYEWAAARSYAKRYLTEAPDSAAGHLLYAKGYLRVQEPNLAIAKGELETALALFDQHPDLGALTGEWTPEVFLGLIHHELATVHLRRIYTLSSNGIGGQAIQFELEEARKHVDLGLKADPDSKSLQMMRETLAELMGEGQPAPG